MENNVHKKTFMLLSGSISLDGVGRVSLFIAKYFVTKGYRVVVLPLFERTSDILDNNELEKQIIIKTFPKKYNPIQHKLKSLPTWLKMIRKNINEYKPDSILAITFKLGALAAFVKPSYAKKITVREINNPLSIARNPLIKFISSALCFSIKSFIFQTNFQKKCYSKRIQNKSVVIPNALMINNNINCLHNEKKLFTLARLDLKQKRLDVLIKAFDLVYQIHPEYVLEIYGRANTEDEYKEILDIINSTSAKNNIRILNPIKNVHEKVKNYRGFILTSDYEGMSNALLECFSLGIPCISSDWDGVEDVLTNNVDSLIYHRQDITQLKNCIIKIIENDAFCDEITANAKQNCKKFDKNTVMSKYFEIITKEKNNGQQ